MDHCRYPRQKRTGRPPYAGLQEIPTSFRVPRDRKDPSSEAASAHIDRRRISCHSLSSHQLPGATNYREEFYPDLEVDTIHALFNIPVAADQQYVVNYAIGKYDAIIVDEASKVADDTFHIIHDRLEKQVHRPLAIIAGEECQQPPLETVNGRTIQTTSILKNRRLHEVCQIQSLDQQLRCTDEAYLDFLQHIRHSKPEQYVLDNFQRPLLLFNQSDLTDYDMWKTIEEAPDATFLTVSGAAATRVNSIITRRMFQEKTPLSSIPLKNDVEEFLPFKHMRVVVTQNLDKSTVLSTASW